MPSYMQRFINSIVPVQPPPKAAPQIIRLSSSDDLPPAPTPWQTPFAPLLFACANQIGGRCFQQDGDNGGWFDITYNHETRNCCGYCPDGYTVTLMCRSIFRITPGRVSPHTVKYAKERNRLLDGCQWHLSTTIAGKQAFMLATEMPRQGFNVHMLDIALQRMLPELAAFDLMLTRE